MSKKKEIRPDNAHVYLIDGKKAYFSGIISKFSLEYKFNVNYLGYGILPKIAKLNDSKFLPKGKRKSNTKRRYFIEGMKCCYCDKKLTENDCTREHILARSKGGTEIIPACKKCNNEKSNMTIGEYISFLLKKCQETSDLNKIKISNAINISKTFNIP